MPEFHAEPYVYLAGEDTVRWRIPFGHHPPFSAGPQHHNTRGMGAVVQLFERSGVRVSFSGHEHNDVEGALTETWSGECHFLLATIDGNGMTVRAIGESPGDALLDIPRATPSGDIIQGPIPAGSTPA